MAEPSYTLDGRPVGGDAFYAAACDPRRHVVVEACAGAGKTWMLVSRIVRALLDGAEPQQILAITFTRKAAGEMRTRLAAWLRDFAALAPEAAAAELCRRGIAPADAAKQAAALVALHERVLSHGRAVEVRTFHAWFSQLLQAAPLDLLASLGLAPRLTLIEDIEDLRPELMRAFHRRVLDEPPLLADYRLLSVRHGRFMLSRWLDAALQRRVEIELADGAGTLADALPPGSSAHPAARVREAACVAAVQALAGALEARRKKLSDDASRALVDALALDSDDTARLAALRAALFTDAGTPRTRLGDLALQASVCAMLDDITRAVAQFEAHQDHAAMVRLSRELFGEYAALKQRRGLVDMPDLERVALHLLSDHDLAGWVQERLDARVRHLLIDEFQDTSPLQWHALHAWLQGYAGAGGGPSAPRLFIVGDPKQSIYRFRRAEPRVFEAAQRFVVDGLGGTLAACDHTRRCAPGVLAVVNAVFGELHDEGALPDWRPHSTQVAVDRGPPALVALPVAERPSRLTRSDADGAAESRWRPSLTEPRHERVDALREAEAATVADAIAALVHGEGVSPGRILVLARKREPLRLLAEALAARRLPFVAPEDTLLAELPEVQDLLAVLDVLASPTQSLALARALKSPLFGVDDASLLALAHEAGGADGWWPALLATREPALQRAARLFAGWQLAAATLPPHDLLDRIVHEGDLLARLAATVPPAWRQRATDAVQALLAAALALDSGRFMTPYAFVHALRRRSVKAPRQAHPQAVQLLTIHGAKGLESRVVFVMDTEPEARRSETATLLVDWPVASARPARVAFIAAEARCPPSLSGLLASEDAAREREELNALYVALTRAEERVVISRTPPRSAVPARSWWSRLAPLARSASGSAHRAAATGAAEPEVVALPLHARSLAPPPEPEGDDRLARLGQAVHRWLEWAAQAPQADRVALAQAAAAAFSVPEQGEVLRLGSAIFDSPDCRRFFSDDLRWAGSEVALADRDGQPRRLDRLVQLGDGQWWVLDYKLSGRPADDPALRAQLAGYRAALEALVGAPVRAAFVTAGGTLVEPR